MHEETAATHVKSSLCYQMVGLDAAGKTTILYKLKLGEVVSTIPTIGFNVETVQHEKINMTVWDGSFHAKTRPVYCTHHSRRLLACSQLAGRPKFELSGCAFL